MIDINNTKTKNIDIIHMKNEYLEVVVTNYGCTIMKLFCMDKEGQFEDVVLGYETVDQYFQCDAYLGGVIGRVANRIDQGTFTLDGKTYKLEINNPPNHLHGGNSGFNNQIFDYKIIDDVTVQFVYLSNDKEEGYPGNLQLTVTYRLENNRLVIKYNATSDKDTIINVTNHSYFNLSAKKENILDHYLQVKADEFACIDKNGLPTGWIEDVTRTPFDFREETRILDSIELPHPQVVLAKGIDHPFLFNSDTNQITLTDRKSGRRLVVSTTLPGAQIYTANYLEGKIGKYKQKYNPRDAICLETQYLPNEINIREDAEMILRKGKTYESMTSYCFDVIEDEKS